MSGWETTMVEPVTNPTQPTFACHRPDARDEAEQPDVGDALSREFLIGGCATSDDFWRAWEFNSFGTRRSFIDDMLNGSHRLAW
ncbi:hypothetical protein [Mycolicibacterium brisbanense]|uniref:Uncharacterized protein n=1 Tax=Mycolicibacterium brisbanense TaxID=146020 RepID=A0A100VWG0_9MYCO|nr:hypothetical protein [Mycolicibacterium brisbanense]MCV7161536.1 hypothetical protein [Mycolicibacterium brisbanense]GAS87171.1 putative uncharacterized protein [Mycolicibacterium brisbanense]